MTRHINFNTDFTCDQCGNYVSAEHMLSGVINRNHCPHCLWSRHMDLFQPGDRLSACKGLMKPIGLTFKHHKNKYKSSKGELMLVHCCMDCGSISINRIAADDDPQEIIPVLELSAASTGRIFHRLSKENIRLIRSDQFELVEHQLFGQAI